MRQFLVGILMFSVLVISSILAVFSLADGSSDAFYLKFTSPKQSNLIVGSSRAAQGILPSEFKATTGISLYNYAFSIAHTPYGKSYYESIEKKLDKSTTNGTFIVCVNPWTLSAMTKNPEDSLHFREIGSSIHNTRFVNFNPNIEYLRESFTARYIEILTNKSRVGEYQTYFLHDDGWLEVTIESDMISSQRRIKSKVDTYRKKLTQYSGLSQNRLHYLKKTIALLQSHGNVYLVRLPVIEDFYQLELELSPNFDSIMRGVSKEYQIDYLNFMDVRDYYDYTDGHHLHIESGKSFTRLLAQRIKESEQTQTP